jgi:phage-related minor tail protein
MAVELATGYVSLVPSAKGFAAATAAQLGAPLANVGAKAGDDVAKSFGGKFAAGMKVAAAAGAAAIGAVGVGLFKVGDAFDSAFDTIRVGTGATGGALKALEGDFKSVVQGVPADFGAAATAIADLNTRTGQTGSGLQELSKRMLEMTRLTGGDLTANIASTTRLFGDWGIASESQADTLDKLFRASQATGVGIDALSQNMVKFGAPLRQLGFGFDQSVGLLAKFEKEGVNAELVMGSLRIALGKMARGGEPAQETLRRVTDEIANAGSVSEANLKALDLFGARAGPDMAAAIREGRFELGDLLDTISSGNETILGAAADTEDFAEKWTKLKNRIFVAIQPVASKFFDVIGNGMDALPRLFDAVAPSIRTVSLGFRALFTAFRDGDVTSDGFVGVMERIGATVRGLMPTIERVVGFLRDNFRPVLIGLGAVVAAVIVPAFVTWAAATVVATAPFLALAAVVAGAIIAFQRFPAVGEAVRAALDGVSAVVGDAVEFVKRIWPDVAEAIGHVLNVAQGFIRTFIDVVSALWRAWGDDIARIVKTVWGGIASVVGGALAIVRGVIQAVLAIINGDWGKAWDGIKMAVQGAWDAVTGIVRTAIGVVASLIGGMASTVAEVAKGVWEPIRTGFKAVLNWIIRAWNKLEFRIPGFDPPGPGPKFAGFVLVPNIPEFHDGGIVPGRRGTETLAILEAGERIIAADQAGLPPAPTASASFAPTLNVTVAKEDETPYEIVRRLGALAYLAG